MAQYLEELDDVFGALSDPTRRLVIGELGRGPASVGELAEKAPMTLPAFMKHIRMLERAGLVWDVVRVSPERQAAKLAS